MLLVQAGFRAPVSTAPASVHGLRHYIDGLGVVTELAVVSVIQCESSDEHEEHDKSYQKGYSVRGALQSTRHGPNRSVSIAPSIIAAAPTPPFDNLFHFHFRTDYLSCHCLSVCRFSLSLRPSSPSVNRRAVEAKVKRFKRSWCLSCWLLNPSKLGPREVNQVTEGVQVQELRGKEYLSTVRLILQHGKVSIELYGTASLTPS